MRYSFLKYSAVTFLLALVSTAAAALGKLDKFTSAKRINSVEYVYMSGVGLVVGGKTYHCDGEKTEWGTTGVFNDVYLTPCE